MTLDEDTGGDVTHTPEQVIGDLLIRHMNQDALREFVERVARGEVRHPVPEARRILGIPVVSTNTGEGTEAGPIQHHERDVHR